jgi:hypothetical protein
MHLGRLTYGVVEGEKPAVAHRLGTISGRSCCGKKIVPVPERDRRRLVVCRRCIAIDDARHEAQPDWF